MVEVSDFLSIHKKGKLCQRKELSLERPKQQSHTTHRFHCLHVKWDVTWLGRGPERQVLCLLYTSKENSNKLRERRKHLEKTGKIR